MRARLQAHAKVLVGAAAFLAALVVSPRSGHALVCSVLDGHPCIYRPFHQVCGVLSFKRNGEIFGKPRVTYVTPGLPGHVRQAYWDAVEAAVERCTPLAFSGGLGGALAGRPFAIRFVDKRSAS